MHFAVCFSPSVLYMLIKKHLTTFICQCGLSRIQILGNRNFFSIWNEWIGNSTEFVLDRTKLNVYLVDILLCRSFVRSIHFRFIQFEFYWNCEDCFDKLGCIVGWKLSSSFLWVCSMCAWYVNARFDFNAELIVIAILTFFSSRTCVS